MNQEEPLRYPVIQVVERPRPINPPPEFVTWQFAFFSQKVLGRRTEDAATVLLETLLAEVLILKHETAEHHVTRLQAELLVEEMQAADIKNVHDGIIWAYQRIAALQQ